MTIIGLILEELFFFALIDIVVCFAIWEN